MFGQNLPVAGGGYFRLFPSHFMHQGIRQAHRHNAPAMLYFHPWEFDPDQPQLPLNRLSRFRTYVGVGKSLSRLKALMDTPGYVFRRACDVVQEWNDSQLPRFRLGQPE
jgi:hypothetical protein